MLRPLERMLHKQSFSNVFSKHDVKLMGLNDFGSVMSFFPAFGMKTTSAADQYFPDRCWELT